jgi:glutathione synthase/RimK-type ligase-like ATP-grasp enzyme
MIILLPFDKYWTNKITESTGIEIKNIQFNVYQNYLLKNKNKLEDIYLIPKDDSYSILLSTYRHKLKKSGYKFLTCDNNIINNLGDKCKLQQHLLKEFLPLQYNINKPIFPCFLKKNTGCYGHTVFLLNNKTEYNNIIEKIKNLNNYILQEAIISPFEWSTQFLVINGKIIKHYTKLIHFNKNIFIRGYQTKTTTTNIIISDTILNIFEQFFKDYNGLINANYKILNDKPIILEFNTRLAGNIHTMTHSEVNELIKCYIKYSNE